MGVNVIVIVSEIIVKELLAVNMYLLIDTIDKNCVYWYNLT